MHQHLLQEQYFFFFIIFFALTTVAEILVAPKLVSTINAPIFVATIHVAPTPVAQILV